MTAGPPPTRVAPTRAAPTRIALVSGASSGIGAAVAERLAQDGHRVVLCGRDAARLAQVAAALGGGAHVLPLDVTDAAAVAALPGSLPAAFGAVDIVVNAAGHDVGGRRPFQDGDADEWAAIIETNLTGTLRLTHALVRAMIARNAPGDVVNIGSLAPLRLAPRMGAYAASKAGVHAFSDVLRADLAPFGIRVTEIMPGLTQTGFAAARLRGDMAGAARFYGKLPTALAPGDVAEAVMGALRQPRHVTVAQVVLVPSSQW